MAADVAYSELVATNISVNGFLIAISVRSVSTGSDTCDNAEVANKQVKRNERKTANLTR
jgi:hypothetical protein